MFRCTYVMLTWGLFFGKQNVLGSSKIKFNALYWGCLTFPKKKNTMQTMSLKVS